MVLLGLREVLQHLDGAAGDGSHWRGGEDEVGALLSGLEACLANVANQGQGSEASPPLLDAAFCIASELAVLFKQTRPSSAVLLADVLPRLQALLTESAALVEQEYASPPGLARTKALWGWDLAADLAAAGGIEAAGRPAWALARVLVEAAAQSLTVGWAASPSEVKAILLPLARAAKGREALLLVLGRLVALSGGDEGVARLVIPLLVDALTPQAGVAAGVEAYVVAGHVLAAVGVACGGSPGGWGYRQVVDLLLKLYNLPHFSISRALLHGQVNYGGAEPESHVVGRCPGGLADALLTLAQGLAGAPDDVRKDLRHRLLAVFSNSTAILPNESYLMDLGSLLPALAAVSGAADLGGGPSATADLSLDALNRLQEEKLSMVALHRQLWLYCGVYDFGGIWQPGAARAWPEAWKAALGTIAAGTPPMILGIEEQRSGAVLERLQSELAARLTRLGPLGTAPALGAALSALVGPSVQQLPAPLLAYLLSIATKVVSHALYADLSIPNMPVEPVLLHLQLTSPGASEYPCLQQILTRVFAVYTERLAAAQAAGLHLETLGATEARLAQVLIRNLTDLGSNPEVPSLANHLLERLVQVFPSLYFEEEVLASLVQTVGDADGQHALALAWVLRILRRATVAAPGRTEATLMEVFRQLTDPQHAPRGKLTGAHLPELLRTVHAARAESSIPGTGLALMGLSAWSAKLHALGCLSGLADSAELEGRPAGAVDWLCAKALSDSAQTWSGERQLRDRFLQAAAALVQSSDSVASQALMRLLCWVPTKFFNPAMLEVAVLAWHWLMAATPSKVQVALLTELADAWLFTVDQCMGIFAGPGTLVADAHEAINAHHIWLTFLQETLNVSRDDNSAHRRAIDGVVRRLLGEVLRDPSRFSALQASCAARFRLLQVALSFCKRPQLTAKDDAVFEGTVRVALEWFAAPVSWQADDKAAMREAAAAVLEFVALLEAFLVQRPKQAAAGGVPPERLALLKLLLAAEGQRLSVWADPLDGPAKAAAGLGGYSAAQWARHVDSAWDVSPQLALGLLWRFPGEAAIKSQLEALVALHAGESSLHAIPFAVELLATPQAAKADVPQFGHLETWAPLGLLDSMALMASSASRHPTVLAYLMRSLLSCPPEDVAFFLPQLVQMLRYDGAGLVEASLLTAAQNSVYFAHLLVCQLASEGTPPAEAFAPLVRRSNWSPPEDSGLWAIADRVRARVLRELHGPVRERLDAELRFFDEITDVSGKLYPVPKEERRSAAVQFLQEITPPREDLYLPTNPRARVRAVIPESAAPMQSAAKCPILVAFEVEEEAADAASTQALIFKVGDDCRQDVLALQVIALLRQEFVGAGLDLYVVPYGVVPTGHECGIIEVVPNAKSRAQLGELTDGGLFEIFQHEFGMPGSKRFEAARQNLIKSCAGYAVASYLLQAKDRHNGNIMLDNKGHIIHIDFGFILGISPGGNMGFESAAFKLSYEMTELLDPGGTRQSPAFLQFQELCVRGFLAARKIADSIVATVAMMVPSQLPCFSRGDPVQAMRSRFCLGMSEAAAAQVLRYLISDAYDKWTTGVYDYIQFLQNAIPK